MSKDESRLLEAKSIAVGYSRAGSSLTRSPRLVLADCSADDGKLWYALLLVFLVS